MVSEISVWKTDFFNEKVTKVSIFNAESGSKSRNSSEYNVRWSDILEIYWPTTRAFLSNSTRHPFAIKKGSLNIYTLDEVRGYGFISCGGWSLPTGPLLYYYCSILFLSIDVFINFTRAGTNVVCLSFYFQILSTVTRRWKSNFRAG